ncbi:MAG: hypothetical protein JWM95_4937 [Gemmatimonadetes bacterium]|nr:hypothetical protein [Gemmatimonadota bacterium]
MSIHSTSPGSSPSAAASAAQMALRQQLLRQRPAAQAAPSAAPAPAAPNAKSAPTAAATTSLPVEAPAGTDPDLWKVLSASERSFFAKVGAMGPLTYGRVINDSQNTATPAMRGGRLDIRG